jgi:arabinogalactan endo-1,4-beta-galactosidase
MLAEIEKNGGVFYDDNGVKTDCLKILKQHGVNYVRLRIWNNPVYTVDVLDDSGNVLYAAGTSLGGGNNTKEVTIQLAKRAKKLGMKVLLDFHYSDWWADPGKQNKPAAWEGLTTEELQLALYNYTKDVLIGMKKANATPDMVQIGNEVNGGMVWPDGKTWTESTDTTIGGYDGFANLLKQGSKAVREVCGKKTKIVIHLSNGGNSSLYVRVFDQLISRNVDFDVIGLSYYPYWHGTLDQLTANMTNISQKYNKELIIAETAYAYTLENGDELGNIFSENNIKAGGYKATIQGQATAIRNIMDAVSTVDGGLGVFYWEPDWIPVDGVGWKTGEGNAWDNQAMFDFNGKALPSLDVFKVSNKGKYIASEIATIQQSYVTTCIGKDFVLPTTVKAEYTDDSIKEVAVIWGEVDPTNLEQVGTFQVEGTVEGTTIKAIANVTVDNNLVSNKSFETANLDNWSITGSTSAVEVQTNSSDAYKGENSLHWWLGEPFNFTCSQTVTGIKDGTYTLKVWSSGGGGENALQLFASDFGGEKLTTNIVNTGWQVWQQYEIQNIEVVGGQCTIGVYLDSLGGNWGNIDEFEFTLNN